MKKLFTLVCAALAAVSVNAQDATENKTYILDINQMYTEASTASGQCVNATLSGGTKYLLNDVTYVQDIFTVVSFSNRTYRVDVVDPAIDYGNYTATARLEPNGASNKTGGRQMFVNVEKAGLLTIGAWGNADRVFAVCSAENTTDYINLGEVTPLYSYTFTGDEADGATYTIYLQPGLYCITQGSGMYYGYVKFQEGATSGIQGVQVEQQADADAPVYNLAGQRVSKDTKGILIQNGKKFVNK